MKFLLFSTSLMTLSYSFLFSIIYKSNYQNSQLRPNLRTRSELKNHRGQNEGNEELGSVWSRWFGWPNWMKTKFWPIICIAKILGMEIMASFGLVIWTHPNHPVKSNDWVRSRSHFICSGFGWRRSCKIAYVAGSGMYGRLLDCRSSLETKP